MEGGGSLRLGPRETVSADFLSRDTCASQLHLSGPTASKPADYQPPVRVSPEPRCYDQTMIITDA
jgi:hypothetical protein